MVKGDLTFVCSLRDLYKSGDLCFSEVHELLCMCVLSNESIWQLNLQTRHEVAEIIIASNINLNIMIEQARKGLSVAESEI